MVFKAALSGGVALGVGCNEIELRPVTLSRHAVRERWRELLVDGRKSGFRGQAVFDNAVRLMETQSEEFEGDREAMRARAVRPGEWVLNRFNVLP